jgi:hypothetical protein
MHSKIIRIKDDVETRAEYSFLKTKLKAQLKIYFSLMAVV